MIWYNNLLLKATLQNVLKKSNQRIIQLAATYGKQSFTYQNYTNILEKGVMEDFVKKRQHVTQRGVDLGTIRVLDIRKLFRAVEQGKIDRTQLNEIITRMAGVKVDQNGNVVKSDMWEYTGIPTVSKVRKETEKRLIRQGIDPREMSLKEIDEATELHFDFSTNFQTSYEEAIKIKKESGLKANPVTARLWDEGRKSYDELVEIKKWLDTYIKEASSKVTKLEDGT